MTRFPSGHRAGLRALPALAAVAVLSACGASENPDLRQHVTRDVPQYSIDQFLTTTSMGGASFSPDGSKILVSSNGSGTFDAYAVPVGGGEPVQLTDWEESVFAESYFPGDERFLFTADRGGNELNHLYVQAPGGEVTDLTPGEDLKAVFVGWARDDRGFFVLTNERDARYFDLYEYDPATYERTLLYRNEEGLDPEAVSPDRRYLALRKSNTTADSDLYLLDRETGEVEHLTPHEGDQANSARTFSPDGRFLYFTSDGGSEFQRLLRHELGTGEREVVYEPGWDVWYAYFSEGGRYFVTGANVDARTQVVVRDAETLEPVELPDLPEGDISGVTFSPDDDRMAFYASGSRFPSDLFVHDLGGGGVTRLTNNLNPAIDPDHLVDGRVVRFTSFDGLEVPGILYIPHQASRSEPVPGLVWVHGGPGGQSRIGYSSVIQYLVNHGYAVYAINNRGSSGYGKTFSKADDRRHGDADLDDVVTSKQLLASTGMVDPDRIGIMGGSYGGYMTLAALTFRPEAFEAGVDLFGISNWVRTLESMPPWWESMREALYTEMGHPEEDREMLRAKSPLFHADSIRRPLMVLQGANDPRVLKVESDDIVEAVRSNGVPVEYVVFDDEGHGFVKKENQLRGYEAVLRFLEEHVKKLEPTEAAG